MANTTFANLKIGALRRCDHYNSGDSTLLEIAGGLINDCLGFIQTQIKTSKYVNDLANSVNTTASQAYVDLTDTDIIEILNVYQATTDTKLRRLTRNEFVSMVPDTTVNVGVADLAYYPDQILNASGQNIWRIYLVPTPSGVIALNYDYIKNIRFSADGTSADAEFCVLPNIYDEWIYALFRHRFFEQIDPENRSRIITAREIADRATATYKEAINSATDYASQMVGAREKGPLILTRVKTTPAPT